MKNSSAKDEWLGGEHVRQNLGAVAIDDGGQNFRFVKKGAGKGGEQFGAFDVAMGGRRTESG